MIKKDEITRVINNIKNNTYLYHKNSHVVDDWQFKIEL